MNDAKLDQHAGVVSTLADNAAGERQVARAEVKQTGRGFTVCQSEIFAVSGGAETLCALVTLAPVKVGA